MNKLGKCDWCGISISEDIEFKKSRYYSGYRNWAKDQEFISNEVKEDAKYQANGIPERIEKQHENGECLVIGLADEKNAEQTLSIIRNLTPDRQVKVLVLAANLARPEHAGEILRITQTLSSDKQVAVLTGRCLGNFLRFGKSREIWGIIETFFPHQRTEILPHVASGLVLNGLASEILSIIEKYSIEKKEAILATPSLIPALIEMECIDQVFAFIQELAPNQQVAVLSSPDIGSHLQTYRQAAGYLTLVESLLPEQQIVVLSVGSPLFDLKNKHGLSKEIFSLIGRLTSDQQAALLSAPNIVGDLASYGNGPQVMDIIEKLSPEQQGEVLTVADAANGLVRNKVDMVRLLALFERLTSDQQVTVINDLPELGYGKRFSDGVFEIIEKLIPEQQLKVVTMSAFFHNRQDSRVSTFIQRLKLPLRYDTQSRHWLPIQTELQDALQ